MTAQSLELYIECLGNVRAVIDIIRSPEPDLFDLMRLETLLQEVRIGPDVSCVWKDSIQGDLASDAVVSVPDITAVRICGDYDFRPV